MDLWIFLLLFSAHLLGACSGWFFGIALGGAWGVQAATSTAGLGVIGVLTAIACAVG